MFLLFMSLQQMVNVYMVAPFPNVGLWSYEEVTVLNDKGRGYAIGGGQITSPRSLFRISTCVKGWSSG